MSGNNLTSHFDELLQYLTAHENKSVLERCWHDLAKRSVRLAFSTNDPKPINRVLMGAPEQIRPYLVSWFKRLEFDVRPSGLARGGWRLESIGNRTRQAKLIATLDSFPFRTTSVIANKDTNKRWLDDLEVEERGHSVHAMQGGKASGK